MAQVAQRLWCPILGSTQKLSGHGSWQPAVGDPVLSSWVGLGDLQRLLCDSKPKPLQTTS